MTREKLLWTANTYISARKRLKSIDKEKEPYRYEKCLQLIATCGLILKKNGVEITL